MGENASLLHPFPKGLKMLAGSAMKFDGPVADSTAAKAVSFVCLNYTSGGSSPQTTTLPSGPCLDGMRAQIIFPSCWDGVNLDSANHQSHVAYPINGQPDTGDCPTTHPIKFMTLFYEFIYNTGSLRSISNGTRSSGFVFANGDAMGYSFHGDFLSGWDEDVLSDAIVQCSGNLFGDLASCPPFVPTLHPETRTPNAADPNAGYCTTTSSVNEKVLGTGFTSLPNCQVVRNGPFQGAGSCTNTTQVVPTITPVSNSTAPTDANYQGCYKDPTGGRALKTKLTSITASAMTIDRCQAGCKAAGFSVAGLQYASECWCGNAFSAGTTKLKNEFCNMACAGNSTQMCGSGNINSIYSSAAVTTLAAPSIPATAGSANYWGCYAEGTGSRLLKSASYANSSNTPTQCAAFCTAKGFPFSGTEYSSECYCGTSAMMQSAVLGTDSGCSMLCSGNATAYCGGSSRLQIYSALAKTNATSSTTSTSTSSTAKSSSTSTTSKASSAASSSTSTKASSSTMLVTTTVNGTATTRTTVVAANGAAATAPTASTSSASATSTSSTAKSSSTSSLSSSSASKNSTSTSTTSTSTKASSSTVLLLSTTTVRVTSTSTGLSTTRTTTSTTTSVVTRTTVVVANAAGVAFPTTTSTKSSSSSSTKKKTSSTKKKTTSTKKKTKTTSSKKHARSLPTRLADQS